MYNGGNQQPPQQQFTNGLYVPPAFRRDGGPVGGGAPQRGGPRPTNYGGRFSYDQRGQGEQQQWDNQVYVHFLIYILFHC